MTSSIVGNPNRDDVTPSRQDSIASLTANTLVMSNGLFSPPSVRTQAQG